jgi:succinyl-CoA synthetase alpha subunit
MDRIIIRKDTYFDSVFLMSVSAELSKQPGLGAGHVVLGTPANLALLRQEGFDEPELAALGATDLVVALRADDAETLEEAADAAARLLAAGTQREVGGPAEVDRPVGLTGGLTRLPDANLALISVPGAYAAYEARKALESGLHVMIFSDNVPLEEEIALKRRARELGLLVMGPDCGTALVAGKPLGFANRVRRGCIGMIGASGTGLQEVACQIHRLGSGVSHILGTGGRDLKEEVGGLATLAAAETLAADSETRVLVVVSKPPAPAVSGAVLAQLARLGKPAVVCFIGDTELESDGSVQVAQTLSEAAWLARCLVTGHSVATTQPYYSSWQDVSRYTAAMTGTQRHLHGLFTGGTLAAEALLLAERELSDVGSNLRDGALPQQGRHTITDLGDDRYTRGRPHPMIDPTPRCEQIVSFGSAPQTAVLLLDLVLGSGCHPDPARPTAEALAAARRANPSLAVVSSVTGTDLDPQGLERQRLTLKEVGAQVLPSNVAAAALAARIARERDGQAV